VNPNHNPICSNRMQEFYESELAGRGALAKAAALALPGA
jgi:hypothetical protein